MALPLSPSLQPKKDPRMSILQLILRPLLIAACLSVTLPGQAHDFRAGAIVIDHPYATPTPAGATNGAAYFRSLRNRGTQADRLVAASTVVAERVELHRMSLDGDIVRMRALDAIDLPAGQEIQMRHGQALHLMLVNLKKPLLAGDRFDLTLRFEKSGEVRVKVWVQQPRSALEHKH